MHPFEWLACAYFAALALAAPWTHVRRSRQVRVGAASLLFSAGIVLTAFAGSDPLRAWLPHVYLVSGYWMPALLVRTPSSTTSFERWLLGTDARLRPVLPAVPLLLRPVAELAYLFCYPLVPASFLVIWVQGSAADVQRFWVAVLASGYACYGSLPWLVSRPPRLAASAAGGPPRVAGVNDFVLGKVSHQLNTFPSGHVAVAGAAAAGALAVSVPAGTAIGAVAAAIAVGAVAGRYHYVVDVALAVAVSAVVLAVVTLIG